MVVSAFATRILAGRMADRLWRAAIFGAGTVVGGIGIGLMCFVSGALAGDAALRRDLRRRQRCCVAHHRRRDGDACRAGAGRIRERPTAISGHERRPAGDDRDPRRGAGADRLALGVRLARRRALPCSSAGSCCCRRRTAAGASDRRRRRAGANLAPKRRARRASGCCSRSTRICGLDDFFVGTACRRVRAGPRRRRADGRQPACI